MRRFLSGVLGVVIIATIVYFGFRGLVRENTVAPAPTKSTTKPKPSAKPSASAEPTTPKPTTAKPSATPTKPAPAKPKPTTAPAAGAPKPPKDAQRMRVRYVYDGDTVSLQAEKKGTLVTTTNKIKVRLIGVDTPEMTPKKECYAPEATAFLRKLLPNNTVVLIAADKQSWDDYRRRLFYLWTDKGVFVDLQIVSAGNAPAIRIWPNVKYHDLLKAAETKAKKEKKGLWGKC